MLASPAPCPPPRPGCRAAARPEAARRAQASGAGPVSDTELLAAIGRDLAAVYAEVLHRPLPANVKALLTHIHAHNDAEPQA